MIHFLAPFLTEIWFPFNVFRYITFRTAWATVTALLLTLALAPWVIARLRALGTVHVAGREELGERHDAKVGTPTMGGTLILAAVAVSTLLWGNLANRFVWILLTVTLGLGAIGFVDDYLKLTRRSHVGLPPRWKLIGQSAVAFALGAYLYYDPVETVRLYMSDGRGALAGTDLPLPFFKEAFLPLGWLYVPFVALVVVGASNAVNLTDGLDGLAAGTLLPAAVAYGGILYVAGHAKFASYLQIPFVREAGEATVFVGALLGALLGFLWYNAHPAEVFMGDTGSLALGGAIGTAAVLAKQEVLLLVVGGIFVAEAVSVILQVGSYRLRGKRIFRMAPLHHHFEQGGMSESKVIVRFWIVSWILALVSLSTMKLR